MKTRKRILCLTIVLAAMLSCVLTACSSGKNGYRINVPEEELNAYLGAYELPAFDVVSDSGEIRSEYKVRVKSVIDPDGENTEVEYGYIEAEKVGVYTVTYSASSSVKNAAEVPDAALKVRFSHEPPGIDIATGELPVSYIKGATYNLPRITFTGSPDYNKTHVKLYHRNSSDGEREEVAIINNTFTATYESGEYVIVIHAESAVGAARDREFVVPARPGPDTVVPGKVAYFDEEFGLSQAKAGYGISISFDSETKRPGDGGSLKVTFEDFDANNSLISLNNLIERDIADYENLTYYVYNPSDELTLLAGYAWFGEEECRPGEWTEVTVKTADIVGGNTGCSASDITGLRIRLFAKSVARVPDGTVAYVSPLYAWNHSMIGSSSIVLAEGYEAFETERYTPRDQNIESITKTDGEEKIVWNENAGTFSIAAGLQPGRHQAELTLTDSEGGTDTYTLTVDVIPAIDGGKIAHFDKDYGVIQVTPSKNVNIEYSTEQKYKGEEGSLKVTFNGTTGQAPLVFDKPSEKNLSDYDYIVYRIYNPNSFAVLAGWTWFGAQTAQPGEWCEIKHPISAGFDGSSATLIDISRLRFRIADPAGKDGEMPSGSAIYLSAVYAGKGYFDGQKNMALYKGYAKSETSVFTADRVTVTIKEGGDGKVSYNAATRKIEVAPGLDTGSYTVTFNVKNADGDVEEFEFTLEVLSEYIPGKMTYFDIPYGVNQASPKNNKVKVSYDTGYRYGNEAGSLRITVGAVTETPDEYDVLAITPIEEIDFGAYDYVVFRMFNPSQRDLTFLWSDTSGWYPIPPFVAKAGEWTEMKVPTKFVEERDLPDKGTTKVHTFAGLRGHGIANYTVYISAMYAVKEADAVTFTVPENSTTLRGGYSATSVEGFTLSGKNAAVTILSDNEKFTWNTATNTLDIAAGLKVGKYTVTLLAGNGNPAHDVMCKYTVEVLPEIVPGKALYFDIPYGVNQASPANSKVSVEYSTEYRYDNEAGSLKVTVGAVTETPDEYDILNVTAMEGFDYSQYDYVVFRVFSPDKEFQLFWSDITGWYPLTAVAKQGEWSEVKVPTRYLDAGQEKVHAFARLRGHAASNYTVYLSAVYGIKGIFEGTASKSAFEGYEATSSDAFTANNVTVKYKSGEDKITWNTQTKKFDIAAGLAAGTHTATFTIHNTADNTCQDYDFTFTFTVQRKSVVVGNFNEADGVNRIGKKWSGEDPTGSYTAISYSTEQHYGNEAGSLKVVCTPGWSIVLDLSFAEQVDLSLYDYVVFRVYLASVEASQNGVIKVRWFDKEGSAVDCPLGRWTEIKVASNFSEFKSIYVENWANYTFYVSAMYAYVEEDTVTVTGGGTHSLTLTPGYEATSSEPYAVSGGDNVTVTKLSGDNKITWNATNNTVEVAAGLGIGTHKAVFVVSNGNVAQNQLIQFTVNVHTTGKICYFDYADGVNNMSVADGVTAEYSTEQKYGSEEGSLKVNVATKGNKKVFDFKANMLTEKWADYTYLVFRVYNSGSTDIQLTPSMHDHWQGFNTAQAGAWTEFKYNVKTCNDGTPPHGTVDPAKQSLQYLFILNPDDAGVDNVTLYISAVYLTNE